ncbi:MAG: exodeoxyribonuclease III [Planctomycetota bacterium]|nr:exodeoxyribonuclease III [Planctomycetota bacterium]
MSELRVATWNVNSLRARMPRFLPWLEAKRPEVVCLQETKVVDELFPREEIEDLGYECAVHGRKTYNGVAILSRVGLEDVQKGLGDGEAEDEHRVISADCGGVQVVCCYVVNGQKVGAERYDYKLRWFERLTSRLERTVDTANEKVLVVGDYNVTFDERDIWNPDQWRGKILCSEPERAALNGLMQRLDLTDAFRAMHPDEGDHYTWWDFRTFAWKRNRGLRIDHVLASQVAMQAMTGVHIDREARDGEKPSDHAPVIAALEV